SGNALEKLRLAAAEIPPGEPVIVMQTSRVPLTRWIVRSLQSFGLDVHLATPLRFNEEFSSLIAKEKIHAFSGKSHFEYSTHSDWARQLQSTHRFKGTFIPYTFESRDGYDDVEKLAMEMGGRI
ncbi:hypothetical protein JZU71_00410, partial [bacterium]|nr:hypothetical protein [bacterium]